MSGAGRDPGTGLRGHVIVEPDAAALALAAAGWLTGCARAGGDSFSIALAGGGTPRTLYEALALPPYRDTVRWSTWRVFFGDERAVPPDDPESNYRMARLALLDRVPVDAAHVHRMQGERSDLGAAAEEYALEMATTLPRARNGAPRLDVVLLGLGENGHTASLFPGTAALEARDTWAVTGRADYAPFDRITMTFAAINAAAHIAFLVTGAAKGDALRGARDGTVPAARVNPVDGELRWFLDAAAAAELA